MANGGLYEVWAWPLPLSMFPGFLGNVRHVVVFFKKGEVPPNPPASARKLGDDFLEATLVGMFS